MNPSDSYFESPLHTYKWINGKYLKIQRKDRAGPALFVSGRKMGDMGLSAGNNSSPRGNPRRDLFFSEAGINADRIAACGQTHSRKVVFLEDTCLPLERIFECDGLITPRNDLFLSVTVADCLPIFLYSLKSSIIGVVHSGWKGTGIVETALNIAGEQFGCTMEEMTAVIGPGIGVCCYSVDEERARLYQSLWGEGTVIQRGGRFFLDLKKANEHILREKGIKQIDILPICTCCDSRLGSFRRQGGASFTRMVALIGFLE